MAAMSLFGSQITSEVGLRLLLSPLGSNVVIRTACCTVGTVLPVYSTFRAIERKEENEQRKWLIYWAAYGSFSIAEVFADKFISWFPMYYHAKFAFLVWLQLPSVDGAKQIYMNHLRPFLLRHQARVDIVVGFAYGELVKLVSAHQAEIEYARNVFSKIMGSDQPVNSTSNHTGERPAIEGPTRTSDDGSNGDG